MTDKLPISMEDFKEVANLLVRRHCQAVSEGKSADDEGFYPILLRGTHGIGKSAAVAQVAESNNYLLVDIRPSQHMPGDTLGIPTENNSITEFRPPKWLHTVSEEGIHKVLQQGYDGVILLLDELDRAQRQVKQGYFQLTGSRSLHNIDLADEVLVFSAVNGQPGETSYAVGDFDPAGLDRWVVYDFSPTTDEWQEWAAKNGIHPFVADFVAKNRSLLDPPEGDDKRNQVVNPSRRSYERLSDLIKMEVGMKQPQNEDELHRIKLAAVGTVGPDVAVQLEQYIQNRENLFSLEEIFEGYNEDLATKLADQDNRVHQRILHQWTSLIDDQGADSLEKRKIKNFTRYLYDAPSAITLAAYKQTDKRDEVRDPFIFTEPPKWFQDQEGRSVDELEDDYDFLDYVMSLYDFDEQTKEDLVESIQERREDLNEEMNDGKDGTV